MDGNVPPQGRRLPSTYGVPLVVWWALFVLALGVVTWASLIPSSQVPGPQISDIVMHVAGYAALGTLLGLAQKRVHPVASVVFVVGSGILLEVAQGLGGLRSPEMKDAIADCFGAVLGVGWVALLRGTRRALRD